MYLKSLELVNFRKFSNSNNKIQFSDAGAYKASVNQDEANVASTVTLVVGKNNAGKTTVVQALERLVNKSDAFTVNDFNYRYLKTLANEYEQGNYKQTPYIEFQVIVGLDKNQEDYLTNVVDFMTLEDAKDDISEVMIASRYEVIEKELFLSAIKEAFEEERKRIEKHGKGREFDAFAVLTRTIEEKKSLFKLRFYNKDDILISSFKLNQLIGLVSIQVRDIESGNALGHAFNKIIKYRYENELSDKKEVVDELLDEANTHLTQEISKTHTDGINRTIERIISENTVQASLMADISFNKLMNSLIKYEYVEDGNHVPENQFGLGYSNLMMIIAALLEHIERYPDTSFNSKINLIAIEEPETHMHPQMQELFIRYINDAVNTLLDLKNKHVNTQMLLTTHSAHIVNSKIQEGGSFNCINYITERDGSSCAISLNDAIVTPEGKNKEKEFEFIKKHIKYGISEALFADGIIIVEGYAEKTILPYYLNRYAGLSHKYVQIVNIDGAHAFVYKDFLRAIGLPTAIITDLDIKRTEDEKNNCIDVKDLVGRTTTNQTIKSYSGTDDLGVLSLPIIAANVHVFSQTKIESHFPTSFEEAFIASNYNNGIVNDVLRRIKPQIYEQIVGQKDKEEYEQNREKSYTWQRKLADDKGAFANELLYELLTNSVDTQPELPEYIKNAFDYIKSRV